MTAPGPAPRLERADPRRVVTVCAPGRLHLGFLDPGASLGRRYGSLGLVVDGFETQVELTGSARHEVTAATAPASGPARRAHWQTFSW